MNKRKLRASGEAVSIIIAVAVLFTVLGYLVYTLSLISPRPTGSSRTIEYIGEELMLFMMNQSNLGSLSLGVKNIGSTATRLTHVIVMDRDGAGRLIIDLNNTRLCEATPPIVSQGAISSVSCIPRYMPIGVITSMGKVFALDARIYSIQLETYLGVPMTVLHGGVSVKTTTELMDYIYPPTLLRSGAINTTLGFNNIYEFTNVSVRGSFNATLVVAGLNPVNSRWNILIIGFAQGDTRSFVEIRNVSSLVQNISLSTVGPFRYRVKIENFMGSTNTSLGITPCYVNNRSTCRVVLDGTAERIVVYGSSSNSSRVEGFDPYLYVGDIDGNGNVEVIFVTQDYNTGTQSSYDDQISVGTALLRPMDANIYPLRLLFMSQPINGRQHSSVILSLRMFFWDNSEDDISNNDNRIVVRVGIYSNESGFFVYHTSLGYYELNRYRNVRPMSFPYIVKDFVINIPSVDKDYFVAIEISDPFLLEGTRNDADIIIGLEYIGMIVSSR